MLAATNFSSLQRRFASDQTRKAYTALNEQFDAYTGVIWQPYTEAAIQARYPGGLSVLCTRDRDYYLLQLELPPPIENPVPAHIHRY